MTKQGTIGSLTAKGIGKLVGGTAKTIVKNPGHSLTAAFVVPGAVGAYKKGLVGATTKSFKPRSSLLEPSSSTSKLF